MRIVDCIQGSPEWFEARRAIPTASCFHEIITPTGKPSTQVDGLICELIAEKYFLGEMDSMSDVATAAMKNGIVCEPNARRFYEMMYDVEVQQVGLMLTDDERVGASPDGLVGEDGGVEIKCPNGSTHVGYLLDGGIPKKYKPQVHGCLWISKRKWWDFVSYVEGLPAHIVRVYPDEYTEQLGRAVEAFLARYDEIEAQLKLPPPELRGELSWDDVPAELTH